MIFNKYLIFSIPDVKTSRDNTVKCTRQSTWQWSISCDNSYV